MCDIHISTPSEIKYEFMVKSQKTTMWYSNQDETLGFVFKYQFAFAKQSIVFFQ